MLTFLAVIGVIATVLFVLFLILIVLSMFFPGADPDEKYTRVIPRQNYNIRR